MKTPLFLPVFTLLTRPVASAAFLRLSVIPLLLGAAMSLTPCASGQSRATSQGTLTQDARVTTRGRAAETTGAPDGVARFNGALYYVKNAQATEITTAQRFAEGITLQSNGQLILQDGRLVRLREGQMVTLAGELRDAPRNIEFPRPVSESLPRGLRRP